MTNETNNDGGVEIVFELRAAYKTDVAQVVDKVKMAVIAFIGIRSSRIVAIKQGTICKTTNGYIQRKATRKALHSNNLRVVYEQD